MPQFNFTLPPLFSILNGLVSKWAQTPISPELSINDPAWNEAGTMNFAKGVVMAKNDTRFLYLALDVTADTGNDPGTGDYFWLTFDVDENRAISSNRDVNYGTYRNQPEKLGIQKYLGPGRWTGLSVPPESEVKVEFGPSPNSATPHRIWKFKIAMTEISASAYSWFGTPFTYFGFRVRSQSPGFVQDTPSNFYRDFSKLNKLTFATKPTAYYGDLGPVIGSVGLIPTTKIGNDGKADTDKNYFIHAQNAAFGGVLSLIGNRSTLSNLYYNQQARKYRILHAEPGSNTFVPLVSSWRNYKWTGSDYDLIAVGADDRQQYPLLNPSVDYSIDDLLIQFPSMGMDAGIHRFRVEFFRENGTTPVPTSAQTLSLFIDNRLPYVDIDSIRHGSQEVGACGIEQIGPAPDGLNFRVTAHDPEGNLRKFDFIANYGENQTRVIYRQSYSDAVAAGANWSGVQNFAIPSTPSIPMPWRPPIQCAYSFRVRAWARTTNGYTHVGYSSYFRTMTLLM
ncbi:MAG: hypothetical protein AAGN35_17975 [Bacteroidota bacterium]